MFDVTTARKVAYGPNDDLQTTVFQDRTDRSKWYMVPVPRLRIQDRQPVFALTSYTANAGSAGVCSFEVELFMPEEARKAAERILPAPVTWGDFTWVSGNAFFQYDLDGVAAAATQTPTLFGTNVAAFQVALADEAQVKSFVAAFTGPGAVSPFRIFYDMGVLTQLLAGKATVKYSASAAIDYERKYETHSDRWGNSSTVLVETRQKLQESGAGSVDVVWGPEVTDEVKQIVRDWGWSTLEKQVSTAVDAARALAQNNENPITATSDFTATYSEDSTVEWSTPVSDFLPAFDQEMWEKLYRHVDNRELSVTFQLCGNLHRDGKYLCDSVDIVVRYPTRTTDNAFKLVPSSGAVAKTYKAPGDASSFDPHYDYKYTVNYGDGQAPYESPWISDTATQISLFPDQFGIRSVDFFDSGIPFDAAVEQVFIDYYDNPPEGQLPRLQTKEMKKGGTVGFFGTYHAALTQPYTYRLRYVMSDGSVTVYQPAKTFGAANAASVPVLSPQAYLASFTFRAIVTKAGGFDQINVNAAFYDMQNDPDGQPLTHSWDDWKVPKEPETYSADNWFFQATPDPRSAYLTLSGNIIFAGGESYSLENINAQYVGKPVLIRDTEEIYTITVNPRLIDWAHVAEVSLTLFQMAGVTGSVTTEAPHPSVSVLNPHHARRSMPGAADVQASGGAGTQINYNFYDLLPPVDKVKSLPMYYLVRRLRTAPEMVFYYNATYILNDGTVRSVDEAKVEGRSQLILPKLPPAPTDAKAATDHIHRVAIKVGAA